MDRALKSFATNSSIFCQLNHLLLVGQPLLLRSFRIDDALRRGRNWYAGFSMILIWFEITSPKVFRSSPAGPRSPHVDSERVHEDNLTAYNRNRCHNRGRPIDSTLSKDWRSPAVSRSGCTVYLSQRDSPFDSWLCIINGQLIVYNQWRICWTKEKQWTDVVIYAP